MYLGGGGGRRTKEKKEGRKEARRDVSGLLVTCAPARVPRVLLRCPEYRAVEESI